MMFWGLSDLLILFNLKFVVFDIKKFTPLLFLSGKDGGRDCLKPNWGCFVMLLFPFGNKKNFWSSLCC